MREALAAFHKDVAVYAFPRTDPVVENIDEKALFVRNVRNCCWRTTFRT